MKINILSAEKSEAIVFTVVVEPTPDQVRLLLVTELYVCQNTGLKLI